MALGRTKIGRRQRQDKVADEDSEAPDEDFASYLAALAPEESVETTGSGRSFGAAQVYQLRLPLMANERLKEIAERRGTSPSALARDWVMQHLADEDSADAYGADPYGADEYGPDEYRADPYGADPYSAGDYYGSAQQPHWPSNDTAGYAQGASEPYPPQAPPQAAAQPVHGRPVPAEPHPQHAPYGPGEPAPVHPDGAHRFEGQLHPPHGAPGAPYVGSHRSPADQRPAQPWQQHAGDVYGSRPEGDPYVPVEGDNEITIPGGEIRY